MARLVPKNASERDLHARLAPRRVLKVSAVLGNRYGTSCQDSSLLKPKPTALAEASNPKAVLWSSWMFWARIAPWEFCAWSIWTFPYGAMNTALRPPAWLNQMAGEGVPVLQLRTIRWPAGTRSDVGTGLGRGLRKLVRPKPLPCPTVSWLATFNWTMPPP